MDGWKEGWIDCATFSNTSISVISWQPLTYCYNTSVSLILGQDSEVSCRSTISRKTNESRTLQYLHFSLSLSHSQETETEREREREVERSAREKEIIRTAYLWHIVCVPECSSGIGERSISAHVHRSGMMF